MGPLCARLSALGPHDRDLMPLLECLTVVRGRGATAGGALGAGGARGGRTQVSIKLLFSTSILKLQVKDVLRRRRAQVAACLGRHLDQYAPGLFATAMRVLEAQAAARAAAAAGHPSPARHPTTGAVVEYDRDLVVCAMDLLSGITDGLGPSMDPLVAGTPLPQVRGRAWGVWV